ncbi:hypothetical protein VNO77_04165 [Canavalia gladiata]|uniref:Uncharacterized protein n=1 Tax=Canavalia gladiata TaxID=3824 RepID=A0AAN9MW18_CANGL
MGVADQVLYHPSYSFCNTYFAKMGLTLYVRAKPLSFCGAGHIDGPLPCLNFTQGSREDGTFRPHQMDLPIGESLHLPLAGCANIDVLTTVSTFDEAIACELEAPYAWVQSFNRDDCKRTLRIKRFRKIIGPRSTLVHESIFHFSHAGWQLLPFGSFHSEGKIWEPRLYQGGASSILGAAANATTMGEDYVMRWRFVLLADQNRMFPKHSDGFSLPLDLRPLSWLQELEDLNVPHDCGHGELHDRS